MKKTTFNCDPVPRKAIIALQTHRDIYPNGMTTYKNKSRDAQYPNLGYVIYETTRCVVVREMK